MKKGEYKLILNGETVEINPHDIPKLYVAYVAAERAKYYAEREKQDEEDFMKIFDEEFGHAMRDLDEIRDWAANNMDLPDARKEVSFVFQL